MCDCDRLRRENAELRAILYPAPNQERIFLLSSRLRIQPQDAKVLSRLMEAPGEVVPHIALRHASGYAGKLDSHKARQNLSQNIGVIRHALAANGLKTSDLRNWHKRGYALSVDAAEKVRGVVG